MESFEFLGGRYNRPEQIMSGPVQAFKAQSAATGRTVFIHRVSTTEAPEEQSALLKLLTTALVKSSDAKRLVLDFGEERGHWYVVTESEPQCALLREWLQTEIANALGGSKSAPAAGTPTIAKPPAPPADPGEFTRFLQRPSVGSPTTSRIIEQKPAVPAPPPAAPATPAIGEFSRLFQTHPVSPANTNLANSGDPVLPTPASPSAPPDAVPVRPLPGEFTSFFNASDAERKTAEPPAAVSAPPFKPPPPVSIQAAQQDAEPNKEPGEFTRFFTPGLPAVPPKPAVQPPALNFERTQNNPYVQRPNSPVPPPHLPSAAPPPKKTEPGEFTRMFSAQASQSPQSQQSYPPPPPVRSDPMGFNQPPAGALNDFSDNLFNNKIDVGNPLPSSQQQQGEFTKVFGVAGSDAPAIQPPAVVSPQREKSMLDDAHGTQQLPAAWPKSPSGLPPSTGSAEHVPSEFTMIMQGGYGQSKPSEGASSAAAPSSSGGGASPISVNLSPIGAAAMPYLGSASGSVAGVHGNVSQHGASASSALGSAHMSAPAMPGASLKAPPANLQLPAAKAAANKKLMLFFVLLGVLALLLIIVVMILIKSK